MGLHDGAGVGEVAGPYRGGAIAATQQWLDSHRELALRFLRRLVSATRWAPEPGNGDRARESLPRTHGVDASIAAPWWVTEVGPGVGRFRMAVSREGDLAMRWPRASASAA